MSTIKLEQIKKLYYNYSPLITNEQLIIKYEQITNKRNCTINNIREVYNTEIINGFLNEAVIKAAFVERFSFKKSPKSTITIFELNIGSSRADICMINGKSMVFEIKTEYDTFSRLDNQLSNYLKTFEYVNLIIPESKIEEALNILYKQVGILTYKKNRIGNIEFNEYRSPIYNNKIDHRTQLLQLTKKQLSDILGSNESNKGNMIDRILNTKTKDEINEIYRHYMKKKYVNKWSYLYQHRNEISPLDYQWFFKNNLSTTTVYK